MALEVQGNFWYDKPHAVLISKSASFLSYNRTSTLRSPDFLFQHLYLTTFHEMVLNVQDKQNN